MRLLWPDGLLCQPLGEVRLPHHCARNCKAMMPKEKKYISENGDPVSTASSFLIVRRFCDAPGEALT